jgi:hypothetical protein
MSGPLFSQSSFLYEHISFALSLFHEVVGLTSVYKGRDISFEECVASQKLKGLGCLEINVIRMTCDVLSAR